MYLAYVLGLICITLLAFIHSFDATCDLREGKASFIPTLVVHTSIWYFVVNTWIMGLSTPEAVFPWMF